MNICYFVSDELAGRFESRGLASFQGFGLNPDGGLNRDYLLNLNGCIYRKDVDKKGYVLLRVNR